MNRTKTIAFVNNKGGSGKTTTCANVGFSLAAMGKKVLLIDGDMQMNLSLSFFDEDRVLEFATGDKNLYLGVKNQQDLSSFVVSTGYDNLDLIPSSTLMSSIEFDLFTKWQRELILNKCLQSIKAADTYDYILIDAPPTLGGWVMNILCASEYVVMPVEASPWGLFGMANMFEFLDSVKQINNNLTILGIAVTKVDLRKKYYRQSLDNLYAIEDVYVFKNMIRIDSNVEWSQDNSMPIQSFKNSARSAKEYELLAKEINERCP